MYHWCFHLHRFNHDKIGISFLSLRCSYDFFCKCRAFHLLNAAVVVAVFAIDIVFGVLWVVLIYVFCVVVVLEAVEVLFHVVGVFFFVVVVIFAVV